MKLPVFRIFYGKTNKRNLRKNKDILKKKEQSKSKLFCKNVNYRTSLYGRYYYEISCPAIIKVLFYSCKLCSFTVVCKKTLLYHLKVKHPNIFPFTCKYCSAKFMMSIFCCNHEKKYHSFTCENCRFNLCCPSRLAEHWAICIRGFFDRDTFSNENLIEACRWCDKCISERAKHCMKSNHILHNSKSKPYSEKVKISCTNLKDKLLPDKVSTETNYSKSMPLLNGYEDTRTESSCEVITSHNSTKSLKENNTNSTILDLFGTISDSESDMEESFNNNNINCYEDNNNDIDNSNTLLKFALTNNMYDSDKSNFEFPSPNDQSISVYNLQSNSLLNSKEISSSLNIVNSVSSPRTQSFSVEYNLNNDFVDCNIHKKDKMKCYLCSFNTVDTKSMADHWLKNHDKINSHLLSKDLNNYNIKESLKSIEEKRIQHIKSEIQRNIDYYSNSLGNMHFPRDRNIKHYNLRKLKYIKYYK